MLLVVANTCIDRSMWVPAMAAACDLVSLDVTAAAQIVSQVMHRLQNISTGVRAEAATLGMDILWQAKENVQVTEVRSRRQID